MTEKKSIETKTEIQEELIEEKKSFGQWNTIIVIVLGIAIIIAFFQAVQISSINSTSMYNGDMMESFSTGNYTLQPSTSQDVSTQSASSNEVPQSLQNVPDMVGGC